ncbi:Mov34/MPN/PAD-1 family protein [Virgibacillus necropolis]|uniref:Mov34/MPN/PAD-1 family protein n=1 Tax=Virgibacillus necropolis TaxID=163877 RepID=UPI00384F09EE
MGINEVIIPHFVLKGVVEHAQSHLPHEACGLLSGTNNKVSSFWRLENELQSERRFFVKKKVMEKTLQKIKELEESVIVAYHSHPTTAPIPSRYDIFSHPDYEIIMMIVSFKSEPKIKCYHIMKSTYEECPFLIET